MGRVVSADLLDRLDGIIERYRLHEGPLLEPVNLEPALEELHQEYVEMPNGVEGAATQWDSRGEQLIGLLYDQSLLKRVKTAQRRFIKAHEFGHVVGDHQQNYITLRTRGKTPGPYDKWREKENNRECDFIAAYLLVKRGVLKEMRGLERGYIAALIDVPEKLVEMRWDIWKKLDR